MTRWQNLLAYNPALASLGCAPERRSHYPLDWLFFSNELHFNGVFALNKPPCSKIFKLKKWLTLPDAAKHLSNICNEEITEADILRLALDGHLKLSVNFVNYTKARCGKVVGYEDVKWKIRIIPKYLIDKIPNFPDEAKGKPLRTMVSMQIDDTRFLNLSDEVTTIQGVWDLPMIGCEMLDIEHKYQVLTGGPVVTLQILEGALVEGHDGVMCQLQARFNDSDLQDALGDLEESLKQHIANNDILEKEQEKALGLLETLKKGNPEKKREAPDYYPAGSLPEDSVLVVRTESLREFEQLIADNETEKSTATKPHGNTEVNAEKREQALGAVFAVLAKWPEECRDKMGKPVASKIAAMVDAKADVFWPGAPPPLATDTIAEYLRDWIKKSNRSRK